MPIPPPNPFDPDFSAEFYRVLSEFNRLRDKWWGNGAGALTDAEHETLNGYYDYLSKLQDRFTHSTPPEIGTPEEFQSYYNPVRNAMDAFRESMNGMGGGAGFADPAVSKAITEDINRGVLNPLRFLAEDINNRLSGDTGIADVLSTQVMRELMRQRDPMTQFMQPNTPNNQQTL